MVLRENEKHIKECVYKFDLSFWQLSALHSSVSRAAVIASDKR